MAKREENFTQWPIKRATLSRKARKERQNLLFF
jgi:hypothetical protein